jgi:hypothetical protein
MTKHSLNKLGFEACAVFEECGEDCIGPGNVVEEVLYVFGAGDRFKIGGEAHKVRS